MSNHVVQHLHGIEDNKIMAHKKQVLYGISPYLGFPKKAESIGVAHTVFSHDNVNGTVVEDRPIGELETLTVLHMKYTIFHISEDDVPNVVGYSAGAEA